MTILAADRHIVFNALGKRCLVLFCALVFSYVQATDARGELRGRDRSTVYGAEAVVLADPESATAQQIGRPGDVDSLAWRLMEVVGVMTRYDVNVELPLIQPVPADQLRLRLCGGTCNIRAAYLPGEGLYFDDSLSPLTNRYHQSILFHELIHHVQTLSGSHEGQGECWKWHDREVEAYALQNRFLQAIGVASRARSPHKVCASPGRERSSDFTSMSKVGHRF